MKRLMIGVLAITLILSGCGKKEPPAETTVPTETAAVTEVTEAATQPETEPIVTETEVPAATEVQEPVIPETEAPTEPAGDPGIVVNASKLNVRKTPGLNGELVKRIASGTKVMILEQRTVSGMIWGRTEDGWVSMKYIQLEHENNSMVPHVENQQTSETQPSNPEGQAEQMDQPAEPQIQSPEAPQIQTPAEPSVTPNESGNSKVPEVPKASETNPPAPVAPESNNQEEPAPTVHQHHWIPISNQAGVYEYNNYVTCSCGERFSNADAWAAHRDSFLDSDELLNHTGYSSGSDRIEVTPPQTTWQCDGCGATQMLDSSSNP